MHSLWLLAGVLAGVFVKSRPEARDCDDSAKLFTLNRDYVRAVSASDITWFEQNLGEDFICTNPDGSLVDREGFLTQMALFIRVTNLEVDDAKLRIIGDFAVINACTRYTLPDGRVGSSRYTDVWARRFGHWVVVSAHITPVL